MKTPITIKLKSTFWYAFAVVITFANTLFCNKIYAQEEDFTVTYSDNYKSGGIPMAKNPLLPKKMRSNKSASKIVLLNENELTEEIKKSFYFAASTWSSVILNCDSIFIEVLPSEIDYDILTNVKYQYRDGICLPSSIIGYLYTDEYKEIRQTDGTIFINSSADWDYNVNSEISEDAKNLPYALMRSIGKILGFGSTTEITANNDYRFSLKRYFSVFDDLIVNNANKKLTSIPLMGGRPNSSLKQYAEEVGQSFYLEMPTGLVKLQSPPFSLENTPFSNLDSKEYPDAIMAGSLNSGEYNLQIDDLTKSILNQLGWNTKNASIIEIIAEDIQDDGLASAYIPHKFKVLTGDYEVSNAKWELILPTVDGINHIMVLPSQGLNCEIAPLFDEDTDDYDNYVVNQDGCIESIVKFSGTLNGSEPVEATYKIAFELKPIIYSVKILDIVDNSPLDSYDVHFEVHYRGADKLHVAIEEEFGSVIRVKYLYEPYLAQGIADHITSPFYAWIDLEASNEYGTATYTIELEPYGVPVEQQYNGQSVIHETALDSTLYRIYNINGIELCRVKSLQELALKGYHGLYIIHKYDNNILTKSFKHIIK